MFYTRRLDGCLGFIDTGFDLYLLEQFKGSREGWMDKP